MKGKKKREIVPILLKLDKELYDFWRELAEVR